MSSLPTLSLQGTYAKVKFGQHSKTREKVAIKVIEKKRYANH